MATGHENLIPFSQRSKDEARENGRKGGIISGQVRRAKIDLRNTLETFLAMASTEDPTKTNEEIMTEKLILKAKQGDTKAFEVVRDTIGQKTPEVVKHNIVETVPIRITYED